MKAREYLNWPLSCKTRRCKPDEIIEHYPVEVETAHKKIPKLIYIRARCSVCKREVNYHAEQKQEKNNG